MRLSRMGIKISRFRGKDGLLSQEILFKSSQLRRYCAGVYGFGNFLVRARNKLIAIVRCNLQRYGCSEVSLPVLQPKNIWIESGRWDLYSGANQLFYFSGRDGEYCVAPTGEEAVLSFMRDSIVSYRDLPVSVFQIGNKYRDELRVRGGIFRSKEFLMKDGYSFHSSFDDMVCEYNSMRSCYFDIFSQLGIDVLAVRALNKNMGGRASEEFVCIADSGEDKVFVDKNLSIALNEEVLQDEEALEDLKEEYKNFDVESFEKVNAIELGHIFQLGTFYSEKMNGFFVDEDGVKRPYYMGCYGIGINRVLGAMCELNCDEEGVIWPMCVAPYVCAVIYINETKNFSEDLYTDLLKSRVEVVLFDKGATFGSCIKDAKLLGFPYVVIVGRRYLDDGLFEVEDRFKGEKHFFDKSGLINFLVDCSKKDSEID